jgi:hypothetical protein
MQFAPDVSPNPSHTAAAVVAVMQAVVQRTWHAEPADPVSNNWGCAGMLLHMHVHRPWQVRAVFGSGLLVLLAVVRWSSWQPRPGQQAYSLKPAVIHALLQQPMASCVNQPAAGHMRRSKQLTIGEDTMSMR